MNLTADELSMIQIMLDDYKVSGAEDPALDSLREKTDKLAISLYNSGEADDER